MKYVCFVYVRYFTAQRSGWRHLEGGYKAGGREDAKPLGPGLFNKTLYKIWSKFSTLVPEVFKKIIREDDFNKEEGKKPRLKFNLCQP